MSIKNNIVIFLVNLFSNVMSLTIILIVLSVLDIQDLKLFYQREAHTFSQRVFLSKFPPNFSTLSSAR